MSKKIISAILVMAMVISMSATALLSSVGAAAETDYEADRTTLKASIQNLVTYGPALEENTIILLQQTGILTFNDDLNCNCGCGEWVELHARNEFWKNYTDADTTVDQYIFNAATTDEEIAEIKADINAKIVAAASAYYFGQDANNELVDATFNAERNELVKAAVSSINGIYDILKAEVGANEDKPEAYAEYYMSDLYKGFATSSKAYNQSIGFNPYLYIISEDDYINDTYYNNYLAQYTVRWYTFAEAREIDAEGTFALENAIRSMAFETGEKVLFWDFINGKYAEFTGIVDDLFTNLVGKIDTYFGETSDIDEQIKAFLKLQIVIDIYDLYIKDVYNNIYTASSAKLLNDVLYAKRIINYVNAENTNTKLLTLMLVDFNELTDGILSGIDAVAPRAEQLLTSTEITNGTALVRKANALLTNWASWASNDDYKAIWNALNDAMNNLKNMLPATEGADAVIVVEANTRKMKNIAETEIGNDRVVVEFAPNWFAYVKYYALLEQAIANFTKVLNSGSLGTPSMPTTDNSALVAAVNKYAYLAGIVGKVLDIVDGEVVLVSTSKDGEPTDQYIATVLYKNALLEKSKGVSTDKISFTNYKNLMKNIIDVAGNNDDKTCLYELVLGHKFGNNEYELGQDTPINQDVAIDSVFVLIDTLIDVIEYLVDGDTSRFGETTGSFDWANDSYVIKSGNDKALEAIESAVANLTKDLTTKVQTYAYILGNIAYLFGWDLEWTGFVAPETESGDNEESSEYCLAAENFPKDVMKNAIAAANKLAQHISETIVEEKDGEYKNIYIYTTYSELIAEYEAFISTVKELLFTEAGAAKLDKFIENVYYYIETYLGESDDWNEYEKLLQKLLEAWNNDSTIGYAYELDLCEYFSDAKTCYEYFALTLAHAAECERYFGNRYNNVGNTEDVVTPFEKNMLNPLTNHIAAIDVSGYTRDWADKYNAVRQIAAAIIAACEDLENCDMPVWYAERVLSECNSIWAEKDNYTVAKLVEYKAGLEALLIEADGLNVYNYVSNTDEAKAIWAAFVEAYANAQYTALDGRCAFADVDAAVAALEAAMAELEKIEAPEGAADADALAAKVAAAEALYARADATTADKEELEVAIAAAKKVLQFNISVLNSTDIEAEIKALDDVMNALSDEMYTGKDLKKAVKVLELQVVVDLYTEASYRKFANAVEAAYAMAEEDTATESAMKAAYASVEARFGDLKLAPVEEEPEVVEPETSVVMEEAIAIYNDAANGYDKAVEGCTAESAAAYNAAINTLKADIENKADDAKLLESIIALNLAKAALTVDVPETCDC